LRPALFFRDAEKAFSSKVIAGLREENASKDRAFEPTQRI
jgi:hypothetical protein